MIAQKRSDASASNEIYEERLIALARTQPDGAAEMVSSLPEGMRARLAFFCYQRRHLHDLGLQIAANCSLGALEAVAGAAGTVMFQQSRAYVKGAAIVRPSGIALARNGKTITLAQTA